ncbi:hypothetical protein JW711_01370 [Candidatus Woesearchaeota archaeon]|nr:hypothetical protein [Candidatus Woesearchaeota archaeon]
MGFFSKFMGKVLESKPELVNTFPAIICNTELLDRLQQREPSRIEQIVQFRSLHPITPLQQGLIEREMYESLLNGKSDDFCALYGMIKTGIHLDFGRLNEGYNTLVRIGNLGGLEQVVKACGIRPVINPQIATMGYDSLAAQGRLEAMDYLVQLTSIPAQFSKRPVLMGFNTLFASRKYAAVLKMQDVSGIKPEIDPSFVQERLAEAVESLDFRSANWIQAISATDYEYDFLGLAAKTLEQGKQNQLANLCALTKKAPSNLPSEVLEGFFRSQDPACLRFLYEQANLGAYQLKYAQDAYALATQQNDSELLVKLCTEFSISPSTKDFESCLAQALIDVNEKATTSLLARIPPSVSVSPLLVNYFLDELRETPTFAALQSMFYEKIGVAYSTGIASFARNVKMGNLRGIILDYEQSDVVKEIDMAGQIYLASKAISNG